MYHHSYIWDIDFQRQEKNDFSIADLTGKPEEEFESPPNWKPDEEYEKKVTVTNTSSQPIYVRVMLFPQIKNQKNEIFESKDIISLLLNVGETDSMWMDGEDGYYYYLKPLSPGQTTEQPILKAVKSGQAGEEYDLSELEIHVISETCTTIDNAHRMIWWQGSIPESGSIYEKIENALREGG